VQKTELSCCPKGRKAKAVIKDEDGGALTAQIHSNSKLNAQERGDQGDVGRLR